MTCRCAVGLLAHPRGDNNRASSSSNSEVGQVDPPAPAALDCHPECRHGLGEVGLRPASRVNGTYVANEDRKSFFLRVRQWCSFKRAWGRRLHGLAPNPYKLRTQEFELFGRALGTLALFGLVQYRVGVALQVCPRALLGATRKLGEVCLPKAGQRVS